MTEKNKHSDKEMENQQKEQEKIMRMAMMEQEARQIEQQLQILDQQIIEMQLLKLHIEELSKGNEKKEILANLGRNIFVEAETKSNEFFVDVGAKTILKKDIKETLEIIEKDIHQLTSGRDSIMHELEKIANQINGI